MRDISLTIAQKEIVAIIGPSGCGKSTLLNMIAGLYPPTSGSIVYKGERVADVNTDVGYMTQKDNLLPWRSVRDNMAFPLELVRRRKRRAGGARRPGDRPGRALMASSTVIRTNCPAECASVRASHECCSMERKPRCSTSRSPRSMPN